MYIVLCVDKFEGRLGEKARTIDHSPGSLTRLYPLDLTLGFHQKQTGHPRIRFGGLRILTDRHWQIGLST